MHAEYHRLFSETLGVFGNLNYIEFLKVYLGPLLIILRIGNKKSNPAMLKCWQSRSFWKREDKDKMRIKLKPVLNRQNQSLVILE